MDSANFINFIKNPGSLHQLSFQELNSLIEAYPYCQNLHFMVMMKAKVEQHKDFEKKLGVAATYCADRKFLFQQVQNPVRPESTSDSHYGAPETSPVANDPAEEILRSSSIVVPPPPVVPDDEDPEIPEELTHTKDETHAPEYISDQILDPDVTIIEDDTGSQLIIKKADMPMHPEDEKRKVVFLEDLFDEKEKIQEIPAITENTIVHEEEIPEESEAPVMEPVAEEEEDESDFPLRDEDIFAVESDAVSDHDMGIPISDADTQTDQIELRELPQENLEEANFQSPGLDLEVDADEPSSESDLIISIPDHIIDDIPFEITNADEAPSDVYHDEDGVDGLNEEEAISDEGNDEISEQSTGIPVVDKKIRMMQEEDKDHTDTPEEDLDHLEGEEFDQDEIEEKEVDELSPLPKIAFKSWPSKFKPSMSTTGESEPIAPAEEEKEELPVNESEVETIKDESLIEQIKSSKHIDIFVEALEKEEDGEKEEKRSIDLTKVIKEHKAKKKKKEDKAKKKKKKAKKAKAKRKEIERIEAEVTPKAKKKKKDKDKKKKKKGIKQLAQKSLTLKEDIISETLAELLVDQGSNKKAIKMYKKLSLIFPEKSAFFAAQIKKLKK